MDKETKDILARQGRVIGTLAVRVTVLEQLLLGKKVIGEEEARAKATELGKEFAQQTEEAINKATARAAQRTKE